jgi:hypothetical protein
MAEPKKTQGQVSWRSAVQLMEAKGSKREAALNLVISEWLVNGDPEPLIHSWSELHYDLILMMIVRMLMGDQALPYRLELKSNGKGAPKKAGVRWRDLFMALVYRERYKKLGSEQAFEETANLFGVLPHTVREAVTAYREIERRVAQNKSKT